MRPCLQTKTRTSLSLLLHPILLSCFWTEFQWLRRKGPWQRGILRWRLKVMNTACSALSLPCVCSRTSHPEKLKAKTRTAFVPTDKFLLFPKNLSKLEKGPMSLRPWLRSYGNLMASEGSGESFLWGWSTWEVDHASADDSRHRSIYIVHTNWVWRALKKKSQ